MISDSIDYVSFAERFVDNDYTVPDEDSVAAKVLYSSENYYPDLFNIGNLIFRVNYLSDALALEMNQVGVRMIPSDIKDTAVKEEVVIYHKRVFDEEAGRDADFYYIIDIVIAKAFAVRRYPGLAGRSSAFISSASGIHNLAELSIDEYISNAMAFLGGQATEVPSEKALLEKLKDRGFYFAAYAGNGISKENRLELFRESVHINLNGQIINQFEVIMYPVVSPLIETAVTLSLERNGKKMYAVTGMITREKTIELRKKYRVHIRIDIERESVLTDVKAVLAFVKDRFYQD